MDLTRDELAGIAGLFGGLSRAELRDACEEVTFKQQGTAPPDEEVDERIEAAIESFHLVSFTAADDDLLVPGPAAFPTIPEGADDLPHILDVSRRTIERSAVADRVVEAAVAELESDPGEKRVEHLRQLSYDLETWGAVDASEIRSRIEELEE